MHLLVIENDTLLNSIITNRLQEAGYHVDSCYHLLDGLAYTKTGKYDCIIADTTLPINSTLLLQTLHSHFTSSAVLLLTAQHAHERTQYIHHLGVIEYLTKPFSLEKLLTRLELLLKKNQAQNHTLLQMDNLVLNSLTHTVTRDEQLILLTDKEFALLEFLLIHKEQTLTREEIANGVWHFNLKDSSNIVDVYIRYLRNKIDKDFEPKLIHTVRGIGYILSCKDQK